jgi:hypothetical protein
MTSVKPKTMSAGDKEFISYAAVGMSAIMLFLSSFAYGKNTESFQLGMLAGIMWFTAGFFTLHRYNVRKKRTIGIVTPVAFIGAVVTTVAFLFVNGPLGR